MKAFFTGIVSSFIGFLLASFVVGFLLIALIVGLITGLLNEMENINRVASLSEPSVLVIRLDYPLSEKTSDDPFDHYDFRTFESRVALGLDDTISSIYRSASDSRIQGIYLNLSSGSQGWASIESIRNALLYFKKSDKWIVAYSEGYSHSSYYLASVANELYLHHEGYLQFQGLNAQSLFFKNSLEKLNIDMQVLRGPDNDFKSAIETFTKDQMSDNSRLQTQALVDELWEYTLNNIALERNISLEDLNNFADQLAINSPQAAKTFNLVDDLKYQDEVRADIKLKMNLANKENIPAITLEDYALLSKNNHLFNELTQMRQGDHIAIVYADGDIISGESDRGIVGSITLSQAIRFAREHEQVKALVLRINSPGGSALASDVILREIAITGELMPVVISFGDIAASGGYYIGAAGHKIFAEPQTITGSIGVFGLFPNLKGFFNNKLGVTFDQAGTNRYSSFGSVTQGLSEFEINQLNEQLKNVYQTFKTHVGEGRSMNQIQVEALAKGRIWSGLAAKQNGLVDELGGLHEAIIAAAEMAKISDYHLLKLPKEASPFDRFMESAGDEAQSWLLDSLLGKFTGNYLPFAKHYNELLHLQEQQGIQARMPFSLVIQ